MNAKAAELVPVFGKVNSMQALPRDPGTARWRRVAMISKSNLVLRAAFAAGLVGCVSTTLAQNSYSDPNMTPTNDLPNPYSARQVMPLPDGRD